MEEDNNTNKKISTCTAAPARKGTVHTGCGWYIDHSVSLATNVPKEHIHGICVHIKNGTTAGRSAIRKAERMKI